MEKKILKNYIDLDKMSRKEVNFKSKLIEWSQKNKMEVSFELIEQFLDRDYNPMFHTEVRRKPFCRHRYGLFQKRVTANVNGIEKIKSDEAFKEAIETAKIQNHAAKEDIAAEENETVIQKILPLQRHQRFSKLRIIQNLRILYKIQPNHPKQIPIRLP